MEALTDSSAYVLLRSDFDHLLAALQNEGYLTVGPTVSGGAIVLDRVDSSVDFPAGKTVKLGPGSCRLEDRADQALFGYALGSNSAKAWLFPSRRTLFSAIVEEGVVRFDPTPEPPPKTAIIGLRDCDLQAIEIQDRVFLYSAHVDPYYRSMRDRLLLIVVDCAEPAPTCFCTSMGGGPAPKSGFDIRLTELLDDRGHRFVLEAGTPAGLSILDLLPIMAATKEDLDARSALEDMASRSFERHLETDGLRDLLYRNAEHPRWTEVADRCLACGNCTMACPTCFCSTVEEVTPIGTSQIRRERTWDSCFNQDFSYIHGGTIRMSTMSRYRQWMTHKLAAWTDQFGVLGCVGCGRCIVWCPVGIDITEEAAVIRATDVSAESSSKRAGT